jgi:peroxiredoxin Q/BCP
MPEPPRAGDRAPGFHLPSTDGDVTLDGLLARGHRLVLAFYAEDATPTCTSELAMLRDAFDTLTDRRAVALAVSADGLESHEAFARRLGGLPFALASDTGAVVAAAYGVRDSSDPRRSRRAVFVIDGDGSVLLALPHFQPNSMTDVEAILHALGFEA